MKVRTFGILLTTCLLLGAGPFALADIFLSAEPPGPDGGSPIWDGVPVEVVPPSGNPCEIFTMTLTEDWDGDPQAFGFTVRTNFGDAATRAAVVDAAWVDTNEDGIADTNWNGLAEDSYQELWTQNSAPGDLFIRVAYREDQPNAGATVATYGLGFDRTDSYREYIKNLYPDYNTFTDGVYDDLAGHTGTVYRGVLFGTGSLEGYVNEVGLYYPDMEFATAFVGESTVREHGLPRQYDFGVENDYPTVLLQGTPTGTAGSVAWLTNADLGEPDAVWAGEWQGSFELPTGGPDPDYNPETMYVELWWSMFCGNDAGIVYNADYPEPLLRIKIIPLPSSLILCGIGVGFVGLVHGLVRRRRSRRS